MSDSLLEQIARLEQHAQESEEVTKLKQRLERLQEQNRKLSHDLKQSETQLKQLQKLNPKRLQETIKRLQKDKQQQQTENQQLKKQVVEYKQRVRQAEQSAQQAEQQGNCTLASNQEPLWADEHYQIFAHSEKNQFIIHDLAAQLSRTVEVEGEEVQVPKARPIPAAIRKQIIELAEAN